MAGRLGDAPPETLRRTRRFPGRLAGIADPQLLDAAAIAIERLTGHEDDRIAKRSLLHGVRENAPGQAAPEVQPTFGNREA